MVGEEVGIFVGRGVGFEVGILAEGVVAEVVTPVVVVVVVVVAAGVVVALVVVELQTQEVVLLVVVVILVLAVVDAGRVDVVSEPQLTQTGGSKLHGHHSYPCAHCKHCSCDTSRGLSELHEPDPEPPDPDPPKPNEPEKKTSRTL